MKICLLSPIFDAYAGFAKLRYHGIGKNKGKGDPGG
jgi:hypothetical protein